MDDPIENQELFVKRVDCLTIQKALEHRLTKLESMNTIAILCTLGTVASVLVALWKLFGGWDPQILSPDLLVHDDENALMNVQIAMPAPLVPHTGNLAWMMTAIHLQGLSSPILDVEALILDYCERYAYYRSYDAVVVVQDSNLRREEIEIANMLDAKISEPTIQRILDKHASIEECLLRIPPDISILDSGVSWAALQSLFEAIVMPYVRAATATKILHKKRSNLIPILDSVIQKYARTVLGSLTSSETLHVCRSEAEEMITYCQILKHHVETNKEALVRIRQNLVEKKVDLSVVRILDIVIWSRFR